MSRPHCETFILITLKRQNNSINYHQYVNIKWETDFFYSKEIYSHQITHYNF